MPANPVFPAGTRGAGVLGILMLDTRFPRPVGDIGNPDSFRVAVCRMTVPGAEPRRVVTSAQSLQQGGVGPLFLDAAQRLQTQGVSAITTSCGFLVLLQKDLQAAVSVPVRTSSLLQLPALLAGGARVGVLTIDAQSLGREHLLAAGVPDDRLPEVPVQGVDPQGEFVQAILGNRTRLDLAHAGADVVRAAQALQAAHPQLTDVVLECTNMPPYAEAVAAVTGLRVHSLLSDPVLCASFGAGWGSLAA